MLSIHFQALALLFTLTSAAAHPAQLKTSQILSISPNSKSCAHAVYGAECKTAEDTVQPIMTSFETYKITSPAEMAALVSLMAFESGDFTFDINYDAATPGKGTRNMQSAALNFLYASSIPALKTKLQKIAGNAKTADSLSAKQVSMVRDLLTNNDVYDFGSAAWFLTTQCSDRIRGELQNAGEAGWEHYITDCVKTTVTPERTAYWQRAMDAFGAC